MNSINLPIPKPGAKLLLTHKVVDLQAVIDYFVRGFDLTDGTRLVKYETLVDPVKGKVMFSLYAERVPNIEISETASPCDTR